MPLYEIELVQIVRKSLVVVIDTDNPVDEKDQDEAMQLAYQYADQKKFTVEETEDGGHFWLGEITEKRAHKARQRIPLDWCPQKTDTTPEETK